MNHQFHLSTSQLADIARNLKEKIVVGLQKDHTEIKCLPTYIHPGRNIKGRATVFDLGGTNFRVATVSVDHHTEISGSAERDITEMKNDGFTREQLFQAQAQTMRKVTIPPETSIGYCFSYPARSLFNGDAELITWTKGVHIAEMEGKPVGQPLLHYLNTNSYGKFNGIKVLNDTVTSLFAGLMNPGYDAYIGIIVGTGTNMAAFFPSEYIPKLKDVNGWSGETPVNLESGNFNPPYLTNLDHQVDAESDNAGYQRFEKAVSGMYLGRIFQAAFPNEKFDECLSAADLSQMINHPCQNREDFVTTAYQIYERSARLVAASLGGLVLNLREAKPGLKRVQVLAEGSLFWSEIKTGRPSYANIVQTALNEVLVSLNLAHVEVSVSRMDNANLIGAAMAVLS